MVTKTRERDRTQPMSLETLNRNLLARKLGVDPGHISRIFNPSDPSWPSLYLAVRICLELGVSLDQLYRHLLGLGKGEPRKG